MNQLQLLSVRKETTKQNLKTRTSTSLEDQSIIFTQNGAKIVSVFSVGWDPCYIIFQISYLPVRACCVVIKPSRKNLLGSKRQAINYFVCICLVPLPIFSF